jgi:hypothetical protein
MTKAISQLFEVATRISTPWALAAFGIAAILVIVHLVAKHRRKELPITWAAIVAIVLLGLVPMILGMFAIYRIRVTVVGPQGTPVEDAEVWSSLGGEPKKVAGGWQFDIPSAARSADSKVTLWASLNAAFLKGSLEVRLAGDLSPAVTIGLTMTRQPRSGDS